jgi:hypothetical protein
MSTSSLHALPDAIRREVLKVFSFVPTQWERDELVQEVWVFALECPDLSPAEIVAKARSRARRLTQDPGYYAAAIDEVPESCFIRDDDEEPGERLEWSNRAELTALVAEKLGVCRRRAQQLVQQKLAELKMSLGDEGPAELSLF